MKHILVVDKDMMNLVMAEHALADSYQVSMAVTGKDAMIWLENNTADMVIMDIELEGMNGIEMIKQLKKDPRWSYIPIIFLTANTDPQMEAECLKMGADDFITKPFIPMVMKSRVDRVMELYDFRCGLEQEVLRKARQMEMVTMRAIASIANTIDAKDKYTSGHSVRVASCAAAIAKKLGLSEEEQRNIKYVGLLHDIGKISIPDAVLNKPSKLTEAEFSLIKKHPVIGGQILKEIRAIPYVREGALFHHERYDGTGYPSGLKGKEIPLFARIICIADAYDAMSTDRSYKKRIGREKIVAEYMRCREKQFDPELADLFVCMLKDGYEVDESLLQENAPDADELLIDSILKGCMEEAANVSMTDFLTGLYNKGYAQSHVEEILRSGHRGTMFMMDLDDFKHINDVSGHIIGDQVLRIYAEILRKVAGNTDLLCRVGGDEFLMFCADMDNREDAAGKAENIIKMLAEDMEAGNMSTDVFTSIGIAVSVPGDDFLSLYKKADKALYFSKRNGKKTYHFFEDAGYEAEDSENDADIDNIRNIIKGRMDFSDGAFNLAYGEFQKVYNFIARYLDREEQNAQILLMTVKNRRPYMSDLPGKEKVMEELKRAITATLRNSDVCTRYSSSQYIVILMGAREGDGNTVIERIMDSLYKQYRCDGFIIQSDICRLD